MNDIFLFVLNIVIDICLYRVFKRQLESKRHVRGDFLTTELHEDLKRKQIRLNKLIFANGILYLVSHLPEFITSILLIIFAEKISFFCSYQYSCDLFNENASFFNVISIVLQFYLYLCFNKNFLNGFWRLTRLNADLMEALHRKKVYVESSSVDSNLKD